MRQSMHTTDMVNAKLQGQFGFVCVDFTADTNAGAGYDYAKEVPAVPVNNGEEKWDRRT